MKVYSTFAVALLLANVSGTQLKSRVSSKFIGLSEKQQDDLKDNTPLGDDIKAVVEKEVKNEQDIEELKQIKKAKVVETK
jgi:hypothetical protein